MGSAAGHFTAGLFPILLGVYWTIQIWRNYMKSLSRRGGQTFQCQILYPLKCRCFTVPIEGVLGMMAMVAGDLEEFVRSEIEPKHFQHATIYTSFGILGILAIFQSGLKRFFPNVDDILYIAFVLPLTVEAILFKFHLGKSMLDMTLHNMLLYSIYGCILTTLAELACRNQVLTSLGRAYFMILQGTWFWQTAVTMKNTDFYNMDNLTDHQMMWLALMFTWHVTAVFIFVIICGLLCSCFFDTKRNRKLSDVEKGDEHSNDDDAEEEKVELLATSDIEE